MDLEAVVGEAFASLLSVRSVARDDDFFQLGGTSLTAALLLTELETRLNIEIPVSTLLENPTSGGLAKRLRVMIDE